MTTPPVAPGAQGSQPWNGPRAEPPPRIPAAVADALCIALLIAANPVTWQLGYTRSHMSPDSVAYLALSRRLLSQGWLHLSGWGHIDNGLILPPLYPLVVGAASRFSDDPLQVMETVSALCLIAVAVPCFLLLRSLSNRVVAVAGVALAQLNAVSVDLFHPLTEPLFLLSLGFALLALRRCLRSDALGPAVLTGALCAASFLTRQTGVFALAIALPLLAASDLLRGVPGGRSAVRAAALSIGFLALAAPYALALAQQTGQHPFTQYFRYGEYVRETSDPGVLAEIAAIRASTAGETAYQSLYTKRRQLRKLLPDASEMYEYAVIPGEPSSVVARILSRLAADPGAFLSRLRVNAGHLRARLGPAYSLLFLAALVAPLLWSRTERSRVERCLLGIFALAYCAGISLITDLVARYVIVVVPFALMQIAAEAHAVGGTRGALAVLVAGASFMQPYSLGTLKPRIHGLDTHPVATLPRVVEPGDAVFSISPLHATLLGGTYRVLPNDALERVVEYGRRTGVRWLLIGRQRTLEGQIAAYENAPWYGDPQRLLERDDVLRWCCGVDGGAAGRFALFEILAAKTQGATSTQGSE